MTNGDINFDFTDPNSNFTQRLKGLAENNGWSNTPLRVIPLQSSEDISCGQADFLGNWLGGINRPNIAELNYADQYRDNFKPSNMAAANEINHIANGWFKFTCMSNNNYSLAPGDPFNSTHERFNCTVYNNSISVEEENLSTSLISVFPNPFNNSIQIMLSDSNLNGSVKIQIFNSIGQVIYNDNVINKQKTLETSSWHKGIYIIKMSDTTKEIYNEVFIKH